MLLSFVQWLQQLSFATAIRESWYVYPIIMTLHLVGIAMFGGLIFITDMRLLGLTMRKRPVADVIEQLRVPKRVGLLLVVTCGLLMFSSKAEEYYYNWLFWTKLSLLGLIALHALAFRSSVYRNPSELDKFASVPVRAKVAAVLSLLLWIGVAIAGRGIGYIDPPLSKLHALLVK
jgi:uncharacterized membrane protein